MTKKQKSIIGGISVLGIAGLICKVVGVLFRIPLAATIGAKGVGLHSLVFPTYNLLLTVSSAGIPVAISRLVAHHLARNDPRNAHRVFRSALVMLTVLGAVATVIMYLCRNLLSNMVGNPDTVYGFMAIAPSLFIVCVMSAFRGYMQGRRHMLPTAVSQLIEQVGKVFIALPLASLGLSYGGGYGTAGGFAYGAAGALLGNSIAEACALIYMMLKHFLTKKELQEYVQDTSIEAQKYGYLSKYLLRVAIPITIGACIVPLAGMIDSAMLVKLMTAGGMDAEEATIRYGLLNGLVLTMINVPTAIAMAMSTNLVPAISAGLTRKDTEYVKKESANGLRIASLIGVPCSFGMAALAKPILYVLFNEKYTVAQLDIGAELLQVSSFTIMLFTMVQATSGILQGLRRQRIPMMTLFAGVVCKVALNYTLVQIPSVNIHGAPIASLLCYFVSTAPNLYYVQKYSGCRLNWQEIIIKPLLASLPMAAAVYGIKLLAGDRMLHGASGMALLGLDILVGILIYALFAWKLKLIHVDDLPFLKRLQRRTK